MRSAIKTSPKGLKVRGIAGTYVVLLAFDCPRSYCPDLLGFGIERIDKTNKEHIWLRGGKKFNLPDSDEGDDVSSRHHPIQKFHWGDYTTKPGRSYTYIVHAYSGSPRKLVEVDKISVDVTCEKPEQVGRNGHQVHFNRSAAASQAFASRFPNLPSGEVTDKAARTWLSRGLEEALIAFIDGTQAQEGLHLFVYEFEKPSFLEALKNAKARGVRLEILHDAILKENRGKLTGPRLESEPAIRKFGLAANAKGRDADGINISHNKFMVRTDAAGNPVAVWTGSTNFTDSGIYGQTNVGHAVADAKLAKQYFDWHQAIWRKPDTSAKESRNIAQQISGLPTATTAGSTLVLSPRQGIEAVTECATLVGTGRSMVCFTAPFAMHDDLEAALAKTPAQVLGLLDKDNVIGPDLRAAPNTQVAAARELNPNSKLEAWQRDLLDESMHHSGVHIHTKILLVDPLSDHPVVVTGSANFSNNSSRNNDENQLFIFGETAVADVYFGEFMRMFEHYHYRDHMAKAMKERQRNPEAGYLDESDGWTARYFDKSQRQVLREAFF